MGTITVKYGSHTETRENISSKLVEKKMKEVLKEHPHLCGSCTAESCDGIIDINNDYIVRGVKTTRRQYVFDCLCYKCALPCTYRPYTYDEIVAKYSSVYNQPFLLYDDSRVVSYDSETGDYFDKDAIAEELKSYDLSTYVKPFVYRKRR